MNGPSRRTRRVVIAAGTILAVSLPASAATILGSRINYRTDLNVVQSSQFRGPSGSSSYICADQGGTLVGQGGSVAQLRRHYTALPDTTVIGIVVEGGRTTQCSSRKTTSSTNRYYTKVTPSWDNDSSGRTYQGWMDARY